VPDLVEDRDQVVEDLVGERRGTGRRGDVLPVGHRPMLHRSGIPKTDFCT
jgi:hypothetical protein